MNPTRLAFHTALGCLFATLASGCFTTTIVSGKPARPATIATEARWHHGVMWGMGEISGPYDLSEICPQGWAEIETETSFANGVASTFGSPFYTPQTVTIRCSAEPAVATAAAAGSPAAAPAQPVEAPLAPTPPIAPPPPPAAAEAAPATAEPAAPPPPPPPPPPAQ